ncbi:NAD(P)/FAD-dependent oxidoreductase [Cryptosporangium arvum]|uniref:Glycine/D-amino acid oxidase, deaminating n=1 Tax=Cryptosporangium arvum DSM 44712 TaxID=927661 RepID=A0A010ZW61_9ACTN|nr:FAD-dependent oxidoreductase [Cryptosporangium arvum]EXG81452.1 glycine/D-amino acid oxidase, deaminating [Cryptosporangium arvum DSM 44712]
MHKSLADVEHGSFWLEDPGRPAATPPLTADTTCDLAVVGGGYSGLWTALIAKERDPSLDVVLLEGARIGHAASGRNGGFCASSLTHGAGNGLARWPSEFAELERLGMENLQAIEDTLVRYGIDAEWERTGELDVATEEYQLAGLHGPDFLDRDAVRAEVNSPTYLGGTWNRRGVAMVHPAKLVWGLAAVCRRLGVRMHEHTPVLSLRGTELRTPKARVRARTVALGTNAYPSPLVRVRPYVIPVYDYALVTEPLSDASLGELGWRNRQGVGDSANQFHYYRLTADNRILWGGYDAIYHFGGRVRDRYDARPSTYETLADHFFTTFPQLEGVRFTNAWGGAIDTCTRFSAFFGTAHGGRVAYAAGYTGLGVGATRFGAEVMLDLLSGEDTPRTRPRMVRTKPVPFPPEPVRFAGVELTRRSLAAADRNQGRRNHWLRTLDALGLGFDS